MKTICFLILGILASYCSFSQIYVKAGATGLNNGSSWKDAYINLDTALSRTSSGEIWVAAGTYIPSTGATMYENFNFFSLNRKVGLYGGFDGTETSKSQRDIIRNETILSGDVGRRNDTTDNTPRVVVMRGNLGDSTMILDGFTVTKASYRISVHLIMKMGRYLLKDARHPDWAILR